MSKQESIVLGGGCFWCLDAGYRLVKGVEEVVSGYAGGFMVNPDYWQVASKRTGHAEVVKVTFDTGQIQLSDILDIFWAMHDPTTYNRQGADEGPEYRSIILYADQDQKEVIDKSVKQVVQLWDDPIVTEVNKLEVFYPAEEEHQNFFAKNPEAGYCQVVINPKLLKLKQKYQSLLK